MVLLLPSPAGGLVASLPVQPISVHVVSSSKCVRSRGGFLPFNSSSKSKFVQPVVSSHCKHALASHVVADLDLGFEFIDSDEDEHIEHVIGFLPVYEKVQKLANPHWKLQHQIKHPYFTRSVRRIPSTRRANFFYVPIRKDFKAFEYKLAGCGVDFNFLSDFWPDTEEIGYEYYYVQFKKYGSELTTSACNYYFSVSLMHDIVTRLLIAHVPFRTSMTLREFEELMPFDAVIDIFEVPYSNDMQIREIGALWTSAGQLIDTGTITYKGDSLKPYCYSQKGYKEGVRVILDF